MSAKAPVTQERRNGPTPHGGAYSIAYYRGRDGSPVPKDQATAVELVEFTESGDQVFRTYLEKTG